MRHFLRLSRGTRLSGRTIAMATIHAQNGNKNNAGAAKLVPLQMCTLKLIETSRKLYILIQVKNFNNLEPKYLVFSGPT